MTTLPADLASTLGRALYDRSHYDLPTSAVCLAAVFLGMLLWTALGMVLAKDLFSRAEKIKGSIGMAAFFTLLMGVLIPITNLGIRDNTQDWSEALVTILSSGRPVVTLKGEMVTVSDTTVSPKATTTAIFGQTAYTPATVRTVSLTVGDAMFADSVIKAATGGRLAIAMPPIKY